VVEKHNWQSEAEKLLGLYRTLGTVPMQGQSPAGDKACIGLLKGAVDVQ